jgi:hypothetical protein
MIDFMDVAPVRSNCKLQSAAIHQENPGNEWFFLMPKKKKKIKLKKL